MLIFKMVDSFFSSLFVSSSPLKHHHVPIKSIEPSKLTTRKSLVFTLGFSFIVFIAFTFFSSSNPSSSYFFDSSPWFNSFIRSKTNPKTSSKSYYFPTLFSYHSNNNNSYNSPYFSHQPNTSPSLYQVSNESSTMHDEVVSFSLESNNSHIISDNKTSGLMLDSESKSDGFMKKENEVKKKYINPKEKAKRNDDHKAVISPKKKGRKKKFKRWVEMVKHCNIFDGRWVRDDSYPLFKPGSCSLIDEPFNCFINGRKDNEYEKYRWQPNHCNIPRMNGKYMLELLRGKRLVFVGDSLNRNMWESMLCILRNAAKDKSNMFEVSGRSEFRTEGSYSFVFQDYNCSVEFYRSPFLVQEWKVLEKDGSKDTLRIDMVESSADKYKNADVLVFNTGHWWTHEKTSNGKGYYQEGERVYDELHVDTAFRKAMTTWAKWVEANIDPVKTLVIFRSYSVSHFRGGEWNSGGRCDGEKEPLKKESEFETDPSMVQILEHVLKKMKAPVFYLNVTRMTNFRKDAHPSIFREKNLPEEARKSPLKFQDCSHWCLPGVPDTWNEIVYSQLLLKHKQAQLLRQRKRQRQQ